MHTVFNQPPPLADYNVFASDRAIVEALRREGAAWAEERVRAFGEIAGRAETIAWGFRISPGAGQIWLHRAFRHLGDRGFRSSTIRQGNSSARREKPKRS
jgi:putative acyl-CoA dehydrogenase